MPRTLARLALALLAVGVLAGPARSQGAPNGKIAPPAALQQAQQGRLTIVDVRTPEEWRETGVGPGVRRIDWRRPDFVPAVLAAVGGNRDAPVALVCRSGNRSAGAQAALRKAGFTRVLDISEGMSGGAHGPGWIRRGLPVAPCPAC